MKKHKAKDPAFLFYPKDWLEGTAEMMPSEKGIYIDLLCNQHQKGSLPSDTNRLARMVGVSHDEFIKVWSFLKDKFEEKENRLYNNRLISVTEDRTNRSSKNLIVGTFAGLLKSAKLPDIIYKQIKSEFKMDDFISDSSETSTNRLTDWFKNRIKTIAIENASIDGSVVYTGNENFIDIWIKDLPNSQDIENISRLNGIDLQLLKDMVPHFKRHVDPEYPTKVKFLIHFRNWVLLEIKKSPMGLKSNKTAPDTQSFYGTGTK